MLIPIVQADVANFVTIIVVADFSKAFPVPTPPPPVLPIPTPVNPTPTPEPTMPTAPIITITSDHNNGAHQWDNVSFNWAVTDAAGVASITVDGSPAAFMGGRSFIMGATPRTISVIATGNDGNQFPPAILTIPLIPAGPVSPSPTPTTPTARIITLNPDHTWSET
jgi:hypothetical protein